MMLIKIIWIAALLGVSKVVKTNGDLGDGLPHFLTAFLPYIGELSYLAALALIVYIVLLEVTKMIFKEVIWLDLRMIFSEEVFPKLGTELSLMRNIIIENFGKGDVKSGDEMLESKTIKKQDEKIIDSIQKQAKKDPKLQQPVGEELSKDNLSQAISVTACKHNP
jgi:hypothetical protein